MYQLNEQKIWKFIERYRFKEDSIQQSWKCLGGIFAPLYGQVSWTSAYMCDRHCKESTFRWMRYLHQMNQNEENRNQLFIHTMYKLEYTGNTNPVGFLKIECITYIA